MNANEQNMNEQALPSAHVRFVKWEYEKIFADSIATGKSIPFLLKRKYFTGRVPRILMTVEERKAVLAELHRCREELNRIAGNVDEGFLEGWHTACSEVARKLTAIESLLVAIYGSR